MYVWCWWKDEKTTTTTTEHTGILLFTHIFSGTKLVRGKFFANSPGNFLGEKQVLIQSNVHTARFLSIKKYRESWSNDGSTQIGEVKQERTLQRTDKKWFRCSDEKYSSSQVAHYHYQPSELPNQIEKSLIWCRVCFLLYFLSKVKF